MKIVLTDAQTVLDDIVNADMLNQFGEVESFGLLKYEEVAEKIADADIVVCNKTLLDSHTMRLAKNLKYFEEICKKQDIKPEDSIMIGNDVDEDLCSAKLGFDTYLITDTIVNRDNKDYSDYKNGSFEEFYKDFLKGD